MTYLEGNEDKILELILNLPIRKIPGIGKVTEQILVGLDIFKCKDILEKAEELCIIKTESAFQFLIRYFSILTIRSSLGIGRCYHEDQDPNAIQKSMGISTTFSNISLYL